MGRHALRDLLKAVYHEPLAIQGDRARKDAALVAMAASLQLITTKIGPAEFSRTWRITAKGLIWLNEENE